MARKYPSEVVKLTLFLIWEVTIQICKFLKKKLKQPEFFYKPLWLHCKNPKPNKSPECLKNLERTFLVLNRFIFHNIDIVIVNTVLFSFFKTVTRDVQLCCFWWGKGGWGIETSNPLVMDYFESTLKTNILLSIFEFRY